MAEANQSQNFAPECPEWVTEYSQGRFAQWHHFTPAAKRALYFMQEEAKRQDTYLFKAHHLLLALLREPGTGAANLLHQAGRDTAQIQDFTRRNFSDKEAKISSYKNYEGASISFLPNIEMVYALDLSIYSMGAEGIGTSSLLMGILLAGDTLARRALWQTDGDFEQLIRAKEAMTEKELFPLEELLHPNFYLRGIFAGIQAEDIDYLDMGREVIDV